MSRISWSDAKDICLVTAVDVEFNAAASLLSSKAFSNEFQIKICRGNLGWRRIALLQCGMGARGFAGRLPDYLKNNRQDVLLIAGLAGGLDVRLKSGDAVFYSLCHDARGDLGNTDSREKPSDCDQNASIRCDDEISGFLSGELWLNKLSQTGRQCFYGPGITVDRIITEARNKILLGNNYKALAVDMESFDVLSVSAALNLPAAVMRIISDDAGSDLPDFNLAATVDGRMNAWRTAVAMAARPKASFQFLRGIKPVLDALRSSLEAVLSA